MRVTEALQIVELGAPHKRGGKMRASLLRCQITLRVHTPFLLQLIRCIASISPR